MPRLAVLLDTWDPRGGDLEQYLLHVIPTIASKGNDVLLVAENARESPPLGCSASALTKGNFWPRPMRDRRNQEQAVKIIEDWQADEVLCLRTLTVANGVHMPIGGSPRDIPRDKETSKRTSALIALEESAMSQARLLIANSAMVAEQIDKYLPNSQQIIPLPLFEQPQQIKPQFDFDYSKPIHLAHCGRDPQRHGLREAYIWFNILKNERPNSRLDCFSKSVKHACHTLGKSVSQLNEEGITIHPWGSGFRQRVHQFDLLIHPSHYDSFSLVCLEAAAAGVPVLCSSDTGIADQLPSTICEAVDIFCPEQMLVVVANDLLQNNQQATAHQIRDDFSLDSHARALLNALF